MLPRVVYYLVVLAFCWVGQAAVGARAQVQVGTFAGGFGHALSSHADGTLWAVGNNEYGQPGTSKEPAQPPPTQVGANTNRGRVMAWAA